jgi:hypothetical protein
MAGLASRAAAQQRSQHHFFSTRANPLIANTAAIKPEKGRPGNEPAFQPLI